MQRIRRRANLQETGELKPDPQSPVLSTISESFLRVGTTLLTVYHRQKKVDSHHLHGITRTLKPRSTITRQQPGLHIRQGDVLKSVIIITLHFGDGWMGAG